MLISTYTASLKTGQFWLILLYVNLYEVYVHCIKTHDSESRGQEEAAGRDERVSYLQVAPLKNSQML